MKFRSFSNTLFIYAKLAVFLTMILIFIHLQRSLVNIIFKNFYKKFITFFHGYFIIKI